MRWHLALAILSVSCGNKDATPAPTPAPTTCEPARITFDGKPFAFTHGALATHKDDAWTIALFSTTNAADGLHKPTEVTCDELLSRREGADSVKISAYDDAPTVGTLAYDFHAILATGMQGDPGQMKKCMPGDTCNTISPKVIARPDAPGAALEMCVTVNVRFKDNDKAEHALVMDGRIRGTYCGIEK